MPKSGYAKGHGIQRVANFRSSMRAVMSSPTSILILVLLENLATSLVRSNAILPVPQAVGEFRLATMRYVKKPFKLNFKP